MIQIYQLSNILLKLTVLGSFESCLALAHVRYMAITVTNFALSASPKFMPILIGAIVHFEFGKGFYDIVNKKFF